MSDNSQQEPLAVWPLIAHLTGVAGFVTCLAIPFAMAFGSLPTALGALTPVLGTGSFWLLSRYA